MECCVKKTVLCKGFSYYVLRSMTTHIYIDVFLNREYTLYIFVYNRIYPKDMNISSTPLLKLEHGDCKCPACP